MAKIPPALQHKIDYIKALDITAEQQAHRVAIEIVAYWTDYYCRIIASTEECNAKPFVIKDITGKEIKILLEEVGCIGIQPSEPWPRTAIDEKGLQPAKNTPPMPPKRVVNENVKFFASKADVADQQKKDNEGHLINLQERIMQIQVGFDSIKSTPAPPEPSGWYLAGCFLCVFILSASLGAILERTL